MFLICRRSVVPVASANSENLRIINHRWLYVFCLTATFSPSENSVRSIFRIQQKITTSHNSTPVTQAQAPPSLTWILTVAFWLSLCTLISDNILNTAFRGIILKYEFVHISSLHKTLQRLLGWNENQSLRWSGPLPPFCSLPLSSLSSVTLTSVLGFELAKHVLPQTFAFHYFLRLELSCPRYPQCSLPHFLHFSAQTDFHYRFLSLSLAIKKPQRLSHNIHLLVDLPQLKWRKLLSERRDVFQPWDGARQRGAHSINICWTS